MDNKFPLKMTQLKEGKLYEREKGGFVMLKSDGQFYFAKDEEFDFNEITDLNLLNCGFELSGLKPPKTLREIFVDYTDDNRTQQRENNFRRLLEKFVEEIEVLKSKLKDME